MPRFVAAFFLAWRIHFEGVRGHKTKAAPAVSSGSGYSLGATALSARRFAEDLKENVARALVALAFAASADAVVDILDQILELFTHRRPFISGSNHSRRQRQGNRRGRVRFSRRKLGWAHHSTSLQISFKPSKHKTPEMPPGIHLHRKNRRPGISIGIHR
jgi:hypothetical protein